MPPPAPWLGTSPSPTFLLRPWVVVVRATVVGVAGRRRNPSRIGVRGMRSYQSLMPAVAGTPRYENWVHWLMERSGVVCAPHPAPSWGQAPALHFSCDPRLSLFGRRWLVSPAGAGIHPGSESGACVRTNRSCRLSPTHQGMKIGCIDRSKGSGVVCAPAPHPLAGDKPQPYISLLRPWAVVVRVTVVGVAGRCRNSSRIGVRDMLSYQSLMPAVAGTPRYENWVHRSIEGFRRRLCPPPRP